MVPDATVLVVSDDDHHVLVLRACLQRGHDRGDVLVAVGDVGIAVVLVHRAVRLVESDRRQGAVRDVGQELRGRQGCPPRRLPVW